MASGEVHPRGDVRPIYLSAGDATDWLNGYPRECIPIFRLTIVSKRKGWEMVYLQVLADAKYRPVIVWPVIMACTSTWHLSRTSLSFHIVASSSCL